MEDDFSEPFDFEARHEEFLQTHTEFREGDIRCFDTTKDANQHLSSLTRNAIHLTSVFPFIAVLGGPELRYVVEPIEVDCQPTMARIWVINKTEGTEP